MAPRSVNPSGTQIETWSTGLAFSANSSIVPSPSGSGRSAGTIRLVSVSVRVGLGTAVSSPERAIGGGALVERGLRKGPAVAAALKAVEEQWIAEGFPAQSRVEAIADAVVGAIIAHADEAQAAAID